MVQKHPHALSEKGLFYERVIYRFCDPLIWGSNAQRFSQCRCGVVGVDGFGDLVILFHSRPRDDPWDLEFDHAFAAVFGAEAAVVGGEEHEGVFGGAACFDGGYDLAHQLIGFAPGEEVGLAEPTGLVTGVIDVVEMHKGEGGAVRCEVSGGGLSGGKRGLGGVLVTRWVDHDVAKVGFD